MNNRATAQKNESLLMFVVLVVLAACAVALVSYILGHEVLPAINHFREQIVHPHTN